MGTERLSAFKQLLRASIRLGKICSWRRGGDDPHWLGGSGLHSLWLEVSAAVELYASLLSPSFMVALEEVPTEGLEGPIGTKFVDWSFEEGCFGRAVNASCSLWISSRSPSTLSCLARLGVILRYPSEPGMLSSIYRP